MTESAPPQSRKLKVSVVTGQGGGGHYAAYRALEAIACERDLPWAFHATDMDEIITQLSAENEIQNAYEMFGVSGHDLYNLMLKSGWTWMWPLKMRLNKFLVKLNYDAGYAFFKRHWQMQKPDLVVSVMPLYNKGLSNSLTEACPGVPYVTLMVDLADYPPAFWMEPETDGDTICPTQKAISQGHSLGLDESRLVRTSGMVLHPKFYQRRELDVSAERLKLELAPQKLTGIVMFGGNGSRAMLEIAKRLEHYGDTLQLIFLCGRNETLAKEIKQLQGYQTRHTVGFTDDVPYYMQLADFFIGKPGPNSLSEAIAMNLPVITECGAATLIHEKYNAKWIEENNLGLVVRSFKQVNRAVETFLSPHVFEQYRANVAAQDNQAIFEVADYLQALMQRTPTQPISSPSLEKPHVAASGR